MFFNITNYLHELGAATRCGGSPCGLFNRELGFCVVAQKAEFGHFFAKLTYKFNNIFTSDIARKVEVEQIFKLSADGDGIQFL